MRPLTWFSVELDGRKVPIYLSTAELTPALKGNRGVTLGESRDRGLAAIYVDASQERWVQDHTLFHELMIHGVLWDTSFARSFEDEEGFALALESRCTYVLKQIGFAWPRRPRGAAALERWARRPRKAGSPRKRATSARAR